MSQAWFIQIVTGMVHSNYVTGMVYSNYVTGMHGSFIYQQSSLLNSGQLIA